MPLATATLHPPKRCASAPAPLPHTPVTLFHNDQRPHQTRNQISSNSHASVPLTSFVLVKQEQRLSHPLAGFPMRRRVSQKALPSSVLVKRVLGPSVVLDDVSALGIPPTCVAWTRAIGHRVGALFWMRWLERKRLAGFREAAVGALRKAQQIVLVKSFSSPCPAPLLQQRFPGRGLATNEWEGCGA